MAIHFLSNDFFCCSCRPGFPLYLLFQKDVAAIPGRKGIGDGEISRDLWY